MTIDIERLTAHLNDPSRLVVLIKAHLWVERSLNEILEAKLEAPEALKVEGMQFGNKVNLLAALGLLAERWAAPIRRLNTMRNHAAHRLDWDLTDDEAEALIRDIERDADVRPATTVNARLVRALVYVLGYLEGQRRIVVHVAEHEDVLAANRYLRAHYQRLGQSQEQSILNAELLAPRPPIPKYDRKHTP